MCVFRCGIQCLFQCGVQFTFPSLYIVCVPVKVYKLLISKSVHCGVFLDAVYNVFADVVYDPSIIPSLVSLLRQLLDPGRAGSLHRTAFFASTVRNEDTRDAFLVALSQSFGLLVLLILALLILTGLVGPLLVCHSVVCFCVSVLHLRLNEYKTVIITQPTVTLQIINVA